MRKLVSCYWNLKLITNTTKLWNCRYIAKIFTIYN